MATDRGTGSEMRAMKVSQRRWNAIDQRGENTGLMNSCSAQRCSAASTASKIPRGV